MKKAYWIWMLLLVVAMLGTFFPSSAWAGPCGDANGPLHPVNVPCACGDIVVSNTVLTSEDKLKDCPPPFALGVRGPAPGDPVVMLDISSAIISCVDGPSGSTVGIQIFGNRVDIDGGSGIIKSCRFGIFGVTSSSTIRRVFVRDNFAGIVLGFDTTGSNRNTLERNLCHNNVHDGISVSGSGNTLDRNYCRGNGGDGIDVAGTFNVFTHNRAQNNGGNGISAPDLTNTTDFRNYAAGNGGPFQCLIDNSTGKYC